MKEDIMPNPKGKEKFVLWLRPETKEEVKKNYADDDCRTMSEFIEKAIRFYLGFLTAKNPSNYLPSIFLSTMQGMVDESDNKHSRLLFKIAVEIALMQNLLAARYEIDPKKLEELRGTCVREVQRLNGHFTFADAIAWQEKR